MTRQTMAFAGLTGCLLVAAPPHVRAGCPAGYDAVPSVGLCGCYGESCSCPDADTKCIKRETACPKDDLLKNFLWLHADAGNSGRTAQATGQILRASSRRDAFGIRKGFKLGQEHRQDIAATIDSCSDQEVTQIAYTFAEAVRIKSCGTPPPAKSATCADVRENIRWSLLEHSTCSPYAREYFKKALDEAEYIQIRANWIRQGFKIAQAHNPEVSDSIDFVGDELLINITTELAKLHKISDLPGAVGGAGNPYSETICKELKQIGE